MYLVHGKVYSFYTVVIAVQTSYLVEGIAQTASLVELGEAQRILTPRLWMLRIILSHQIPSCCCCGWSRAHL